MLLYCLNIPNVYYQGNVEIYHQGIWGGICDDEWDIAEARIACKELGYPGVIAATHGGSYGHTPAIIWMDNMYCFGGEKHLHVSNFFVNYES